MDKQKILPVFTLILMIGITSCSSDNTETIAPYNILFFVIDDLRPYIGAYGDSIAVTPNIDRLAAEGVIFKKAYVQQAVCAPSRASMLTGLRPDQIKVWDLQTHVREHIPDVITLPQFFKQNGYHTREVGKIFHDPESAKDPVSWSGPSRFHVTQNLPGHKYALPENLEGIVGWKAAASEMIDADDSVYIDGKVTEAAIEMIHEIKDSTFFLAVGFRRPHLPFSAPMRYWDLYDRDDIPMPENPLPTEDAPEYAVHNWGELRGYADIPSDGDLSDTKIKELRHGYYASISYMDTQIGRVIDELERLNLKEKTIIVFWSDHGFHLGERNLWGKTSNYELDTRIPLIISVPGQESAGEHVEAIVESVDLYPTLADLNMLPIPDGLAGKSLKPFIKKPDTKWDKPALSQFPWPWFFGDQPEVMGYAIRTDQYRYVQWNNFSSGEIVDVELYDHDTDPLESKNIALDESNKEILKELRQKLLEAYEDGFVKGYHGF